MSEPGAGPGVKTRAIAPGIFEVFLPLPSRPSIVNVYLLDCGDGWALVDTGVALAASREAFHAALAEVGAEPAALRHLIATHHHPDHFGASEALRAATGAAVFLHRAELERIEYTLAAGPGDMVAHSRRNGMPIPPDVTDAPRPAEVWAGTFQPTRRIDRFLEDGDVLTIGTRRLQVVWTPGHTPGHCCFLDLDARALFVGDHLLPKITPHVGVYATGPRNPLGDFVASQEKVARLEDVGL
ncbi:MAG TPA: MBL fold metallo-hydrolase, partial [Candidatus Binatia bacterium]|nr:MBL fold metallo-hydrolase [Candidatus Binatia bacterium]